MATIAASPAAPTETAALDLSNLRGVWTTYTNEDLGLTFEYPAAYDAEPLKSWGCGLRASDNGVFFGSDNSLSVAAADGLDLAEYVDRYIEQRGASFDPWRRDAIDRGDAPSGIIVEYFLRGVNHSGILAFFEHGGKVYIFHVSLSLACSLAQIDLISPGPFYHAIESFKFTR
jgi:hypothetical protein